jgi:hypothetical protein
VPSVEIERRQMRIGHAPRGVSYSTKQKRDTMLEGAGRSFTDTTIPSLVC